MVDEGPEEGSVETYTRTFTEDDVREFADLSRDEGTHHVVEQGDGRLMVHGLLTATLPTKIGGDIDYVARRMAFEFRQPVYTGEAVTCELTVDAVEETDGRLEVAVSFVCTNEDDDVVLRGDSDGVVFGWETGGH